MPERNQDVESRVIFLGLIIGCLLTSLAVCGIVGWSVYAAELEAERQHLEGCDDFP